MPPISSGPPSVALQGKLEMEIAQLSPDDAAMFMQEYGIEELSLNRMIRLSYDLLQLQSFFTVGEDEVRAWTDADAVRLRRSRPARSTPTCSAASCAPRWWPMTTWSSWAG